MSLDNLKLSPFLTKELYENCLLDVAEKNKKKAPSHLTVPAAEEISSITLSSSTEIKYLGNNSKHILLLIDEKDHAFPKDPELNFLISILDACKISLEDTALVNCHNDSNAVYENLMAQFSPNIILFLGTEPQLHGFPIQIPPYKVQEYNKQQYLCAASLQQLAANKEEKKQLWSALKKIFSIV